MTPQLTIPKSGDPFYNKYGYGGYNPCILGNKNKRVPGLNVLPNCTAYATGRFNFIGNFVKNGKLIYLGDTDACNYVSLARRQGLEISMEPALGGVMVWAGGTGGHGHVAPVEIIKDEDTILTSESEYYGKAWTLYTRRRGDGNWRDGCYWMGKSYKYIGCIVNPAIGREMTREETKRLIKDMFPELFTANMADYNKSIQNKPADSYAQDALKWAKERGIMVGDATGNQMPQSPLKREDFAVILHALEQGD